MTHHLDSRTSRLAEASVAALRAPSILNTQPWRWRLAGEHAELWADRSRRLAGLDPDGRLLVVSCGSALHHASVALRAAGFTADIERLPDPGRPDLVARISQGPPCPADDWQLRAIPHRRTDRRPFGDTRPSGAALAGLRAAAERHGVHLHVVRKDQLTEFAAAAGHAGAVEHADARYRDDVSAWTRKGWQLGDNLAAYTTVPSVRQAITPRELGIAAVGGLDPAAGADRGTVYVILATDTDAPRDWLLAGEALSDVWLTLTARGLAASALTEVVEVVPARAALRRLLGGVGSPALALRIGVPSP